MKTFLFATTAIVGMAGAAAADVTVSGNAEMGIFGASGSEVVTVTGTGAGPGSAASTSDDDIDTQFFTDVDVTFTMTGETDNGLSFGASIDIDEGGSGAAAVANNADDGGIAIFLTGAFGTLTLGDTDGALDWALTEVAFNSGSLNDDETTHAGYNGNSALDGFGGGDGQILRYDYTVGDFGFAVSLEQVDDADGSVAALAGAPVVAGVGSADIEGEVYGLGFRYSGEFAGIDLGFGLGYQNHDSDIADADAIGASLNSTFGDFTAGISYLTVDVDDNGGGTLDGLGYDHYGVGIGYSSGAISASLNYGEYDFDNGGSAEGFGLSAGYDLGGGAVVQFGYGDGDGDVLTGDVAGGNFDTTSVDQETYSFGVRLNF